MLKINHEQDALLRLPDPIGFYPKLAAEIRRDYTRVVGYLNEQALMDEVVRSYDHAAYTLRITHLPTLVRWVKADVVWAKGLRSEPSADLWVRSAGNRNLAAADLLSNLSSLPGGR